MSSPQRALQIEPNGVDDESSPITTPQILEEVQIEQDQQTVIVEPVEESKTSIDFPPPPVTKPISANYFDSFIYHSVPEQSANSDDDEEYDADEEEVGVEMETDPVEEVQPEIKEILEEPVGKVAAHPPTLKKKPPKSVAIPGEYGPDYKKNPLLGARCIFCLVLINPAPIVKCEDCDILNPYICIQCFKDGSEGVTHVRSHRYKLIDPKGPQLFKSRKGKKEFGIMEDVAVLQMLCEYTKDNWIEKNLVFPELTYNDALDRLEELLMSDVGTLMRNNDPVSQVRRVLPADLVELFGSETGPMDVVKMKQAMPKMRTRFCKFMENADNISDETLANHVEAFFEESKTVENEEEDIEGEATEVVKKISTLNVDEFEDQAAEIEFDENGDPITRFTAEDGLFQAVLNHLNEMAQNKQLEGMVPVDGTVDRSLDPKLKEFNPLKFLQMLKERQENDSRTATVTEEELYIEPPASPDRKDKKKRLSFSETQSPSLDDAKKIKKLKKHKKVRFSQNVKSLEQRRAMMAEERRRLREDDKQQFPSPSGSLDDSMELGLLPDDACMPAFQVTPAKRNTDVPTARELAISRLDSMLETFHRNMGFQPQDDWGENIDDQFGHALDPHDEDYDENDPRMMSPLGIMPGYDDGYGSTLRKKICAKLIKGRVLSRNYQEHKKAFHDKWKSKVAFESFQPTATECQKPDPGFAIVNDPADGFYQAYDAPHDDKEIDAKTMSDVYDVLTYNSVRHDYDVDNMPEAETILNLMSQRHEPMEVENMVRMFKMNSYQRVLKERGAQASIAREYELIPSFMEITKTEKEPVGHYPYLDEKFESSGMNHLKEKYKQYFLPLYQVSTKHMFDDYFKSLMKVEDLKVRITELQELQKKGETSLQD